RLIAKVHAGLRTNRQKAAVAERSEIQAETVKILRQKNGAAHFRVDGSAESVGEGQAERQRREFVDVSNKPPVVRPQRANLQLLFVAALMLAIDDPEIVVAHRGIFPGTETKLAALRPSA